MLDGGIPAFLLGLAIHFCVALFWSTVYYLITRSTPAMRNLVRTPLGALAFALGYGPVIWMMMSLVLIPAFVHRPPSFTPIWWVQLFGHSVFVVLPMVWAFGDGRSTNTTNDR